MSDYFTLTEEERKFLERQNEKRNEELAPYAQKDGDAVYLLPPKDVTPLRPNFSREADFILNSPFYNRYADKTQVFSFYKNDDLTRRALHVQLVSKIARGIGRALCLNLDLIEAIALGHDMGHPPFGHRGEQYLSEEYHARTGRYFRHNVHSARIFRYIFDCRLSLQTLSGILAHNGEKPMREYSPAPLGDFDGFDATLERCYTEEGFDATLRPNTLEGCVVRLSDMIAYVGKDRQDLYRSGLVTDKTFSGSSLLGTRNREIVSRLTTNLVKNSLGAPSLSMDEEVFEAMQRQIRENYEIIYDHEALNRPYETIVRPLMAGLYDRLLEDVKAGRENSPIFLHYLSDRIVRKNYFSQDGVLSTEPNELVTDFIASMTDDYFIDVCKYLHIDDRLTGSALTYREYFEG